MSKTTPKLTPEAARNMIAALRGYDLDVQPSGFVFYIKSWDFMEKCVQCGRIQPMNRQWCTCRRITWEA